jgi:hypothetical protein
MGHGVRYHQDIISLVVRRQYRLLNHEIGVEARFGAVICRSAGPLTSTASLYRCGLNLSMTLLHHLFLYEDVYYTPQALDNLHYLQLHQNPRRRPVLTDEI